MRCPFCKSLNTAVSDSRVRNQGEVIWRRRKCLSCGRRFSSREKLDLSYLLVIKRGGGKEPFSREKILLGIVKSFGKRPIPEDKLERLVDEIISDIQSLGVTQIKSQIIGNIVLEKLRKVDLVAYIRFASVFKEFKDLEGFKEELMELEGKRGK